MPDHMDLCIFTEINHLASFFGVNMDCRWRTSKFYLKRKINMFQRNCHITDDFNFSANKNVNPAVKVYKQKLQTSITVKN